MLYGKKIIILEEVTSTLLSNEIKKKIKLREADRIGLGAHVKERKRRRKKVRAHQRHVIFVTGKVIGRMTIGTNKSD